MDYIIPNEVHASSDSFTVADLSVIKCELIYLPTLQSALQNTLTHQQKFVAPTRCLHTQVTYAYAHYAQR